MKIIVPSSIKEQLVLALERAGNHETGGILMGAHVGIDEFQVKEITIEPKLGTFASFVRALSNALTSLDKYFKINKFDYTHFNYIGEWHSHPSCIPLPSSKDIATIMESVNDKKIGANFLVLIIFKLHSSRSIEGSATVFYPNLPYTRCELIILDK